MKDEKFWHEKHPLLPMAYSGRVLGVRTMFGFKMKQKPYDVDVRTFIHPVDVVVEEIMEHDIFRTPLPFLREKYSESMIIKKIQTWVMASITYVSDKKSWDCRDAWQYPEETLLLRIGDCEDGAILIATMLILAGIAPWRVRVTAGHVQASPTAPQGGHAYVTVCRGDDWVAIDWCYFPEVKDMLTDRTPVKSVKFYKGVWFSFNHLYSWTHRDTGIFAGRVQQYNRAA